MDKSFLIIVDDFSERVLEYDNVSLIDYGYENVVTYYDNLYDISTGVYSGYGNYDTIYYDIYDDSPGFALVTPDTEGYSSASDLDLIYSDTFTDVFGYQAFYDQFYEFVRIEQTSEISPNHGDWVVEAIHQTLESPERTALVCIDVDTLNGEFSHLDDLFDQTSFSFQGTQYTGSNLEAILFTAYDIYDARFNPASNDTYTFGGLSISIAGALPSINELNTFATFEAIGSPIFQAAPNVNQGFYDWGSVYPDVVNVGAWNLDANQDLLLSSPETLITLDVVADGMISKDGWGTNFGTSFATPKVAAETLNHINRSLADLNRSGTNVSDLSAEVPEFDYSELVDSIVDLISTDVFVEFSADGTLFQQTINVLNNTILQNGYFPKTYAGTSGGLDGFQVNFASLASDDQFDVTSVTDIDASPNTVAEDASVTTLVGITAFAEDLDAADSVTYSLTNDAGGLFAINSTSGVVSVKASLDYEASQQHTITVQALSTDQSTESFDFTISVTNVAEGQPFVSFPKTLVPSDAYSSDQEVRALLGEDEYQYIWGTGEEPIQLTYSFTSASTFQLDDAYEESFGVYTELLNLGFDTALDSGQFDPYFLGFNNNQKDWIRQSLDDWGNACNIDFFEVDEASTGSYGDIRFFGFDFVAFEEFFPGFIDGAAGFAYMPDYDGSDDALQGDVFLDSYYEPGDGFFEHLVAHEIGHAVGLSHPHDGLINHPLNNSESVMSYDEGHFLAITPMPADIKATEFLYGDTQANIGDTTHNWSLGQLQTFRMSVVDDGGADDSIDISNWQPDASRSSMDSSGVGASINLSPDSWSSLSENGVFNSDINASSSPSYTSNLADWEYNFGQIYIAPDAEIENLIATNWSDVVFDNSSANEISLGDGNDNLFLSAGSDIAFGGEGEDTLVLNHEKQHYNIEEFSSSDGAGYRITDTQTNETNDVFDFEFVEFFTDAWTNISERIGISDWSNELQSNAIILFGNEVGSVGSPFELVDYADVRDSDQIYSSSELTRGEWAIEFTLSEIEGYTADNGHRFFVFIEGQQVGFKDLQAGMEIANIYLDGWDDPNGASEGISAEELGDGSTAEITVKIGNADLTEIFVETDESAPFILNLDLASPVSEEPTVDNPNPFPSFLYLTNGEEIGERLTNDIFGLSDDVSLSNYTIQPADWMAGGTGIGWLSVNSMTGELAGTIQGYNGYRQAEYFASASDDLGNSYSAEIAVLTNPWVNGGEDLVINYHHWTNWGEEPEELTGAYANFGQSAHTISQNITLAPNMVVEPDGSQHFFTDYSFLSNQESEIHFHGNRFDDVFVGSQSLESNYVWTGGNDQFIGQEGGDNRLDLGWYGEYVNLEFGEGHTDGVAFTIDNGNTTITTNFGTLTATNLRVVKSSELDDVITFQNMDDFYKIYNFGGTDTINANNTKLNAKIYPLNGTAGKYVINGYNQSSVIRIDDKIFEDVLGLSVEADYEAATSVYKADGKTYVDIFGANNQSIEKILTLNGDYDLTEFKDLGVKGVELRFGELDDGAFQLTESDDDFTGSQFEPNIIHGLGGNDVLKGGPFADQIYGGEGDDDFFATAGSDFYDGGGGFTNELMYRSHDIGPIQANFEEKKVTLADGTFHTFENIQSIHGTSYNDTFIGSDAQRELFFGNGGSDTFEGRGGYNWFGVNENWTNYRTINSLDENKIYIKDYGYSDYWDADLLISNEIVIYNHGLNDSIWKTNINFTQNDDPENPKTFIGIDNGQEVVADIVTLDGDFKLFFAEKRDHNDSIKLTLKDNAEGLSADVVWLFLGGEYYMPKYYDEVIAVAGNWNFDGDDWQTKLDISYANNQTIISDTLGQSSSFILDGNFDFDTVKSEFVTHNSGAEYLHLHLIDLDGVDFSIKPSFGHEKKGFMDKLQSVKLKDKSEGSEFSIAEQMADTMMGSQKFQKNKTYELHIEHEQQTDGAIDIDDLLEVAKMVSGRKAPSDDIQKMAADWDGNGSIDIDDLLGVAKRVAGRVKDDDWKFYDNTNGKKLDYDPVAKVHKMDVVLEDNMEIDLSAILRGDVNASYEAGTHDVAPTTQQPSPRIFSDIQSPQQNDILITQVDVV